MERNETERKAGLIRGRAGDVGMRTALFKSTDEGPFSASPFLMVLIGQWEPCVQKKSVSPPRKFSNCNEIFLQFTAATAHEHPHLSAVIANYSVLLEEMGRSPAQIRAQVKEVVQSILRF